MKRFIGCTMLFVVLLGCMESTTAQTKRTVKKRPAGTRQTTKSRSRDTSGLLTTPPAVADTGANALTNGQGLELPKSTPSLRNDNAVDMNPLRDRTPLAYENIREDDAVYRQRVWLEIDVHEKMNLPFLYKALESNGDQRFIYILLNSIKNDSITAFNPIDDRFTTPMTFQEVSKQLVGGCKTESVHDWVKDPSGTKDITKDTTVCPEFNADTVQRFWVKEDIIFDKESSRLHFRILGIAPVVYKTLVASDNMPNSAAPVYPVPLFWIYYPDIRPVLAKYQAYNGKNYGARMSWEEIFESRMFTSRVIKSTLDNPYDRFIEGYINDPILRLLEGEYIKEKIFNYEQDLWQY